MNKRKELFLINLKPNEDAELISILGGQTINKRLADLGLTPGTRIKVLRKAPFFGPIEIEVRGSKLVLGRGVASKILVKKYG